MEGAAVLLGALALSEEVAFIVSEIKRFLIQLCSSQSRPGQESRALPILGPLARNKLPWLEALPVVVEDRADECVVRQLVPRGIAARTR